MKDSEHTPTKRQSLPVRWVEETGFLVMPESGVPSDTRQLIAPNILIPEEPQAPHPRGT